MTFKTYVLSLSFSVSVDGNSVSASCYSSRLCTMYAYNKDPSNAQAIPLEKTPGKDLFETLAHHIQDSYIPSLFLDCVFILSFPYPK